MKKSKILVIEDEEDIQNLLHINLEAAGYRVFFTDNGYDGLRIAKEEQPEIIILDLMLPHMDGLEVCRRLKKDDRLKHIMVIMLTAKSEEMDRVVGFELGADDYVVKPFSIRELLLRIKAVLRREDRSDLSSERIWKHKGLEFDFEAMEFKVDGVNVSLTATEMKLLQELIQNEGRVLSRERLLNNVWGYEFEGYARTVDTHVRRLRAKLEPYSDLIQTARGLGYKLSTQQLQ
ncbi:response regulator transcription factor [Desulfonatronospira sp.]|uniref:response regulator transcription factor n=1 Tax=Desulfonatronospira sp. TaxID=1962951 RepID=UPI0025B7F30A|nr:response regulator transcription factor [Desulfonatronospira sp.]